MAEPLSPGERHMIAERLDSWLMCSDDGRSRRLERRLARFLREHYCGRCFEFDGEIFRVDSRTPAGTISRVEVDHVG